MAGVSPRRCLGVDGRRCSARIRGASRCTACSSEHERAREQRRAGERRVLEPWRMLYSSADWKRARRLRLSMDSSACVDCGAVRGVSVDHVVPLRDLWRVHVVEEARGVDAFIIAATDLAFLRTRCGSCHGTIEADRRRAA